MDSARLGDTSTNTVSGALTMKEPSYPAVAPCRPAPALRPEKSQPPDCLRYRTPAHWAAARIAKKKTLLSVAVLTGSLHKAE